MAECAVVATPDSLIRPGGVRWRDSLRLALSAVSTCGPVWNTEPPFRPGRRADVAPRAAPRLSRCVERVDRVGGLGNVVAERDAAPGPEPLGVGQFRYTYQESPIRVRSLQTREELEAARQLLFVAFQAKSSSAKSEVIGKTLLTAFAHSGSYVAGAYLNGKLVGCALGIIGMADREPPTGPFDTGARGPLILYSLIAGVDPSSQNAGVGFELKRDQREWALSRGISTIRWTFDPLVRRNAFFNLCKLGATVVDYEPNLYGELDDGLNRGEITDRLVVEWSLESPQVKDAVDGSPVLLDDAVRSRAGAQLVAIPEDLEGLRRGSLIRWLLARLFRVRIPSPTAAHRQRIRSEFQRWLGLGYRVIGITRQGEYVLVPGDRHDGAIDG